MSGPRYKPLRILQVVQSYFPFQEHGGPVVKVRALSRKLSQHGHRVTVLTADLGLTERTGIETRIERCPWGWRTEDDGVHTIYLSTSAKYRALTLNPQLLRFCRASLKDFDVVHFYGLYDLLGPSVSYFCRHMGIPYVIEPMGMYRPIDRSFKLKKLWHAILGRAFLQNAARMVTTSEMEQNDLLNDGVCPSKIVIRYNGVDPQMGGPLPHRGVFRAKWGITPDQLLVLFLGRLIPRKGADILIDAFARSCPSGRLAIAGPEGEPGYLAQLQAHAKRCGAAELVIFTGPLYDQEKVAALADADLFVLPSRYENFANVAAEAMAFGVPVIVSDACGISSLVEGKAGLVIPPRAEAVAEALRRILGDQSLYTRLKAGCPMVAEQLSWDTLAVQMEGYYAQAVGKS